MNVTTEMCLTEIPNDRKANDDDCENASSNESISPLINRREKQQKILLVIFASFSTFLYVGGVFGWGPMQLLLEANGNFASICNNESINSTINNINDEDHMVICTDQTKAFLDCKFVSLLTLLTGTVWGILSDRYGNMVLIRSFGFCNVLGLVLLIFAIWFPGSIIDGPFLYGAFILIGLGATVGGMLTVETGLLFNHHKTQSRVISLLNALFDAGAMTYLGLWGLEKLTSSDDNNTNLILIIGGYLFAAIVFIYGYTYFFRSIQRINISRKCGRCYCNDSEDDEEKKEGKVDMENAKKQFLTELNASNISPDIAIDQEVFESSKENNLTSSNCQHSYILIAERSANDQLKSKAYILMGIWFSFHTISNLWTLTTARDFLGELGDDTYGNRYLSIFTLMTPVSLVALPFLDVAMNKFGFHASLQVVNFLAIAHGIIKVVIKDLNIQILGFVFFSFFRCFLYSVSLSCVPTFVGSNVVGRAIGTLYVLSGLASIANIGLAQLAVKVEGGFFISNLIFLAGTIPMIYVTYEIGRALRKDREALEQRKKQEHRVQDGER